MKVDRRTFADYPEWVPTTAASIPVESTQSRERGRVAGRLLLALAVAAGVLALRVTADTDWMGWLPAAGRTAGGHLDRGDPAMGGRLSQAAGLSAPRG